MCQDCAVLIRYLVLIVIDLRSRRVRIAGITPAPEGRWIRQVARNLTDGTTGSWPGIAT